MSERMTIEKVLNKKKQKQKITMLTAYDYSLGSLMDASGVDMVLVGDSVANVVLGLESTRDVGMTEMLHHAKAVRKGVKRALVIGDMPFESYQADTNQSVHNAKRFIEEAGCDAIKLEWFEQCPEVTAKIVQAGIAVMGHVGLTPQRAEEMGGFKVQGKDKESAHQIIEQAKILEQQGCFAVVLECIPTPVAEIITQRLSIPTIGIGAGIHCDGQVLVTHDLLGLSDRFRPKFMKQYVDLKSVVLKGINQFCQEVEKGIFPDESRSYNMNAQELERLKKEEEI